MCAAFRSAVMQGTLEPMSLPERGLYHVGARSLTFVDHQRAERSIRVSLWYPALVTENQTSSLPSHEAQHLPIGSAPPDTSGAPYPLVIYSHGYGGSAYEFSTILEPLVTHGFVVANIVHSDTISAFIFIDNPLDVIYVIDQLALVNQDANSVFAGLMNSEKVGVVGYNFGAYTALAAGGARLNTGVVSRLDPEFMRRYHPDWDWAAMAAYHDRLTPEADTPLWSSATSPSIHAVIAYIPCGTWFFGARGLASVTAPTLLIGATDQSMCSYELDTVAAYVGLRTETHYLLTLTDSSGVPSSTVGMTERIVQQFVTAFLGYHLQGRTQYADYLTAEYAESLDGVVWGIDETAVAAPRCASED